MLSLLNFCKLRFNCFTFSNSSENIAILYTILSKAIHFLPVSFLFDNKTLIVLLESLFSSLSVNFKWNDCNWEFKISIYLKSGYLSFALEGTLKRELVIENVRAIYWIVSKKYLLLLDQTILLHFRSTIQGRIQGGKIRFFGVKSWFFTWNTPTFFAPPSARCNFFKCAPPLSWNPGSAPGIDRTLNLPQYPGSNNYFSIPEENI